MNFAAELDAIPPDALSERFEETIVHDIDLKAWRKLEKPERLERKTFNEAMKGFGRKATS